MTNIIPIDAHTLADKKANNQVLIVDVREANEFAESHIPHAISLPLSSLETHLATLSHETRDIVFQCQKGKRGETAAQKALAGELAGKTVYNLSGGIEAWQAAGQPLVSQQSSTSLPLNRQVFIVAGSLILLFSLLNISGIHATAWLTLLMGGGLLFAGLTGWCGMALLLKQMPWNRKK